MAVHIQDLVELAIRALPISYIALFYLFSINGTRELECSLQIDSAYQETDKRTMLTVAETVVGDRQASTTTLLGSLEPLDDCSIVTSPPSSLRLLSTPGLPCFTFHFAIHSSISTMVLSKLNDFFNQRCTDSVPPSVTATRSTQGHRILPIWKVYFHKLDLSSCLL